MIFERKVRRAMKLKKDNEKRRMEKQIKKRLKKGE
jgi:hypothetical protein